MLIKLLLTGGTIDKSYNESNGELDFSETHISKILNIGRNRTAIKIEQVMLKDSLDMDDGDRELIVSACKNTSQNKILITHGTDTMVETAKLIAKQKIAKTVVLTGAMIPFVFKHTDAVFNLGFALASVQTLPHGVYIAMNGQVFEWDKVTKNLNLGQFEKK
ncbi:MAG: asparaginase domain-containing protein [Cocleimonas sp.]